MASWLNWIAGISPQEGISHKPGFGIRSGVVSSNIDLLKQGKVLVRLPDLGMEVWARLCAPGAGSNKGLFFAPNIGDEVLLAFDLHHPSSSYVLGGLWGTRATPPVSAVPLSETTTRVFRTGVTSALGHQVEFDDLKQSITITTSTKQKVAIDPTSIEVSTTGGTLSVKLDLTQQSVSITAPLSISLQSQGEIKLSATSITINGTATTSIKGGIVTIN
jgi:uncharacterized protein involved in type VI secretion and phage assembly